MAAFLPASGRDCDGRTTVVVHFLDNSSKTILVESSTEVIEVVTEVYNRLQIKDESIPVDYFGLYSSDGSTCQEHLSNQENVLEAQEQCAKLVFKVRLLMHRTVLTRCPAVTHLMYIQAVHHIVTGYYYITESDAARLAAVSVIERYGNRDDETDPLTTEVIASNIHELLPAELLDDKGAAAWAHDILDKYTILKNLEKDFNPKMTYMSLLESLGSTADAFMCTLFPCSQVDLDPSVPKDIVVGINADGLKILDKATLEMFEEYQLSDVYQWGFDQDDRNFYLRLKRDSDRIVFQSPRGIEMSVLLTDVACARLQDIVDDDETDSSSGDGEEGEEDDMLGLMVKVQAVWRRALARVRMKKEYGAVQFQALWRGYQGRMKYDRLVDEL